MCWRSPINAPKKKCLVDGAMNDNPIHKGREKTRNTIKRNH